MDQNEDHGIGGEKVTYKIAICDDCDADRQYVLQMVCVWASSAGHGVHTDLFSSAESFLFHYAEESDYDILLLDIEMGAMDGVTMAKQLRKSNDTIQIVFITGYSDYISEGYEVAALHYLMKPVKEEKLRSVLDRAVEKISKNEKVLVFEISGEMVRVPICQIRYADVQGNYVPYKIGKLQIQGFSEPATPKNKITELSHYAKGRPVKTTGGLFAWNARKEAEIF